MRLSRLFIARPLGRTKGVLYDEKKFFSIILGLFTNIFVFAQSIATAGAVEARPVTIPVFNSESDRFFGIEFQNALLRAKSRKFPFISLFVDGFAIPRNLVPLDNSDNLGFVMREAGAIGGMYPIINEYLSVMGGVAFGHDIVYIAQSGNFFIGAGLFGSYDPWGIGLGVLGGYYRDSYRELVLSDDGFYHGIIDDQPEEITNAARFMIVTRLLLSDKIFFLDDLSANFGFSEKTDAFTFLSRLAFKAFQIGAARLGIDVYCNQYKYNILLDQRLYGARFDSKYLSLDIGYRQFLNTNNNTFVSNYRDGMYGKIIAKIWATWASGPTTILLLSYGFEQTFEMRHFFGIGVQVGPNKLRFDSLIEMTIPFAMRGGMFSNYLD